MTLARITNGLGMGAGACVSNLPRAAPKPSFRAPRRFGRVKSKDWPLAGSLARHRVMGFNPK